MKIAIDTSPLNDKSLLSHRVRGVGFYIKNLKEALLKYHPENEYVFFTRGEKIEDSADLVHYPYFEPFFITLPLLQKHKRIITVHDLTPLVFPKNFPVGIKGNFAWQIQKLNLLRSDGILTDSKSSKDDIYKHVNIPEDKIDVAYLAAGEDFKQTENLKLKTEISKKYNLPKKFVLYVGDVTWNKNLPRLVKAVTQLKIPLVMVGAALVNEYFDESNPWNQDLLETQELAEDNKDIIRLGFVSTDDLVKLYNLATVFAMPSIYEGFGLPILEAMQSGCPVVTTKTGSLPEVSGDAAKYVDAYDVDSIADGIAEVFENSRLQKELSEKGLKQAAKFSWQKTAEQTIETYRKVLRG